MDFSPDTGTIRALRLRVSWEELWVRMLGHLPSRQVLMLGREPLEHAMTMLCNDKEEVSRH